MKPAHERVAARLIVTANGCAEYQGARFRYGYGNVRVLRPDGTWGNKGAHIVMYEHANGPVPDGMKVMHTCDNPPCCDPAHLTVGTQADNLADMRSKGRYRNGNTAKTHCVHGHEFSPENTGTDHRGGRYCRTCGRAATIAWKQAQRTTRR